MDLALVQSEIVASKPYFKAVSPGIGGLFTGTAKEVAKAVGIGVTVTKKTKDLIKGVPAEEIVADLASGRITGRLMRRPSKLVTKAHLHVQNVDKRDWRRKNGMGGRSWIETPGQYDLVIIFHDANRAGPHIDVHIGRFSVIRRVKPEVYQQLRFNPNGKLTENSRKVLINFLRSEINNNSRLPQNLDHSKSNARASWTGGARTDVGYGAAITRQIVLEDVAEVFKVSNGPGKTIEFYAPAINPHRAMYIHRLYPATKTTAPILIWGNMSNKIPQLDDRLHLKLVHPEDLPKLETKADPKTFTAKYDGSSCYFIIDKDKTTVWSPRISKTTGERIEYTFMLDGIAQLNSRDNFLVNPNTGEDMQGTIIGMGELMFKIPPRWPWEKPVYVPQAVGGGLLNSNAVLPTGIKPEIRIYRIDKVGRNKTGDWEFFANRELQKQVAALDPERFAVVEQMDYRTALSHGFEGIVAVPPGKSVNDGYKVKAWQDDTHDWLLNEITFAPGPKGGVTGVAWFTSLENGKKYKLGPSNMGNREFVTELMNDPDRYIGRVAKVRSRMGHEGRASQFVDWHADKGLW